MSKLNVTVDTQNNEIAIVLDDKQETYSLTQIPEATASLVLNSKQEILHEMSLESVLTNLERSGDLMFVAYNAVAGYKRGELQAKMSGLQKTLADLCNDCVLTMQLFQHESGEVLGYLIKTYKWLLKGKENIAINNLSRCEGSAKKMADESEKLAARFDAIAKTTEVVLEDTQKEQGVQYEKQKELEKQLRDLETEKKRTEILQKEVASSAKEMQELYNDAKARERTESNRAFVLGLASTITSTIGAGVATYAAVSNPLRGLGLAEPQVNQPSNPQSNSDKKELDELKKQIKEKNKEVEQKNNEAQKVQQEAESKAKNAAKAKEDALAAEQVAIQAQQETEKEKPKVSQEQAEAAKLEAIKKNEIAKKAQKEAEKAKQQAEEKKAIANEAATAAKELAASLDKMSENFLKVADSIRQEKMQYLNKKWELEKQNREALAAITEYAERIKNTDIEKGMSEVAVESLQHAIGALKQIVTSLLNASLFWRSMEQYCQSLSQSKLKEDIEDIQSLELDERLEEYHDKDFMYTSVLYIARWKALEVICTEYLDAANKARKKVLNNIEAAPSIEEARKQAPALAEQMLEQTKKDIAKLDSRIEEIQSEQKALAPA